MESLRFREFGSLQKKSLNFYKHVSWLARAVKFVFGWSNKVANCRNIGKFSLSDVDFLFSGKRCKNFVELYDKRSISCDVVIRIDLLSSFEKLKVIERSLET